MQRSTDQCRATIVASQREIPESQLATHNSSAFHLIPICGNKFLALLASSRLENPIYISSKENNRIQITPQSRQLRAPCFPSRPAYCGLSSFVQPSVKFCPVVSNPKKSRRIISMSAPRMASQHAPKRFPRPANRPVFVDGINGVLAARWRISALPAKESASRSAVNDDDLNQKPAHKPLDFRRND
jgi:hypothetical protein